MALLTRNDIIGALERLGELAVQNGYAIDLLAVGGAVMVLRYSTRLATHDIDAMVRIEEIAAEALAHHSLQVRSLLQEFLREGVVLADIPQPQTKNDEILALSAALLELFGERSKQRAPSWTAQIGPVQQPIFLVEAANRLPRLRALCEQEAPEPLRKRRIYAPPNYLKLA